jgi:hypothetical protein
VAVVFILRPDPAKAMTQPLRFLSVCLRHGASVWACAVLSSPCWWFPARAVIYSNFQASVKPFKLPHESWLDSVSVCTLMAIFVADIQKDMKTIKTVQYSANLFYIVLGGGLLVLVTTAVLAQVFTRKTIR